MLKICLAVAVVVAGVLADDPKLKPFFNNDYELKTADKDNYASILTKLGVGQDSVDQIKESKPTIALTYNHETQEYTLDFKGTGRFDHKEAFLEGREGEVNKYGLAAKSSYEIQGDTIKDVCKVGDKTVDITWKFSDDKLECVVEHDGTTANREYIRKQTDAWAVETKERGSGAAPGA